MTKKLTVEFLQFNKPKLNGDRSSTYADCYDFEIKLNGLVMHKFSQYRPFWESVGPYDETLIEATKYAEDLADTLDLKRPKLVTMVKKVVREEQWVPAEEDYAAGFTAGDPGHRENRDNG